MSGPGALMHSRRHQVTEEADAGPGSRGPRPPSATPASPPPPPSERGGRSGLKEPAQPGSRPAPAAHTLLFPKPWPWSPLSIPQPGPQRPLSIPQPGPQSPLSIPQPRPWSPVRLQSPSPQPPLSIPQPRPWSPPAVSKAPNRRPRTSGSAAPQPASHSAELPAFCLTPLIFNRSCLLRDPRDGFPPSAVSSRKIKVIYAAWRLLNSAVGRPVHAGRGGPGACERAGTLSQGGLRLLQSRADIARFHKPPGQRSPASPSRRPHPTHASHPGQGGG